MGHQPHNQNRSPSRHQRNSESHIPYPQVTKRSEHLDLESGGVHQHGRAGHNFLTVPRSLGRSHDHDTHKRTRSKGQAEVVASLLKRGIDSQDFYSAVREGILSENSVWDYKFLTGDERQQLSKSLIGK